MQVCGHQWYVWTHGRRYRQSGELPSHSVISSGHQKHGNNPFRCYFHRYLHRGLTMPPLTSRRPATTSKTSTSAWQEVTSTLRTWSVNRMTSSGRMNSEMHWSLGAEGEIGQAEFDLHRSGLENTRCNVVVNLFDCPYLSQNALCLEAPPLCLCSDSHSSAHRHKCSIPHIP